VALGAGLIEVELQAEESAYYSADSLAGSGKARLHSYTILMYIYASAAATCEPRF